MTRLRNIGLNMLIYFCYFFGACVVVMFAEALFLYILDKFVYLSYFAQVVIRIVIYTLGIPAVIAVLGYFEGYREASCAVDEVIVGGLLAEVIPHFLLAALFHFQPFASGAVRFIAVLLVGGRDVELSDMTSTTSGQLIGAFAAYAVLYIAVLAVSKSIGAEKRLSDRAALRRFEEPDEDTTE